MALVSLKDIPLPANITPPLAAISRPEMGGCEPLLNTMWDNEILMFINETQLIERRKWRPMRRRTRRKGEGGEQSESPPRHSKGEILRGSQHSPHKKKALFDFLLWDLLSLLKCLIGSINF